MATATDANGNKTVYNYDSRDGLTLVYGENAGGGVTLMAVRKRT